MATFFTVGLQTGAKRYSSWNVTSPDFDIDNVDISTVYANYDLTALGGSRTVQNNVGCLRITRPHHVLNNAVWTFNFRYDITSVNVLWKTSQSVSAEIRTNNDWVSINGRTVTLKTDLFQDYGNCYILLLVNEPLGSTTYTYTETLQNIVSDGAESYNDGDTFTIHYTANDGYLIESLTSNIGTVTIADDKRTAILTGSATQDIVVEGVATQYGTILITGSFVHCSCNYSNGETISPSKPRLEIVADDGFIFLNEFKYKQAGVTKYLNKSDDNKMLYKNLDSRGLNLNDVYTAVTAPKTMTSFVHLYKTNDNELSALAKARFKDVSGNTVDYGQYISALYHIPVDLTAISGDTSNIMLGQYDSMVASTLLNQYLVDIDGGTITIPEKFHNAYDYLTTECILHLPFLDEINLPAHYVVNQTINIKYKLDLYSGTLTANIYSSYLNSIVANTSGVIVTNIPFIQKQIDNVVNSLTNVFTNLIPTAFMEVTRNIPYDNVNVFGKECVDFDMIGNKAGYLKCDNVSLVTKATKNEKDDVGKTIAKVYIKFFNGEKMVRTVYLDEEKNRYVKINGKLCLIPKLHADVEFF